MQRTTVSRAIQAATFTSTAAPAMRSIISTTTLASSRCFPTPARRVSPASAIRCAPDKAQVFGEIHRVLRPGGRLYLADVVVQRELKYEVRNNPELWAACVAGALPEQELAELALSCRLRDPRITERFDCFRDTTAETKVARDLQIQAVNFVARK